MEAMVEVRKAKQQMERQLKEQIEGLQEQLEQSKILTNAKQEQIDKLKAEIIVLKETQNIKPPNIKSDSNDKQQIMNDPKAGSPGQ